MDREDRDLQRKAEQGDADAAERLYWTSLRRGITASLLDRLVEAALKKKGGKSPTIWDKLNFVRDEPLVATPAADMRTEQARWRSIASSDLLHTIPRRIRRPGFCTYVTADRAAYQVQHDGSWSRVAALTAPPPLLPFYVVQRLSDRDQIHVVDSVSCLVLENGGIYTGRRGPPDPYNSNPNVRVQWSNVRFEKRLGR